MVTYQKIFLFKSETCEKSYFFAFFDMYFFQLIKKIRNKAVEGNTVMTLQEISSLVFNIISLLLAHLCLNSLLIIIQVGVCFLQVFHSHSGSVDAAHFSTVPPSFAFHHAVLLSWNNATHLNGRS